MPVRLPRAKPPAAGTATSPARPRTTSDKRGLPHRRSRTYFMGLQSLNGAVAQLGEHQAGSLRVVGSIPSGSTIFKPPKIGDSEQQRPISGVFFIPSRAGNFCRFYYDLVRFGTGGGTRVVHLWYTLPLIFSFNSDNRAPAKPLIWMPYGAACDPSGSARPFSLEGI